MESKGINRVRIVRRNTRRNPPDLGPVHISRNLTTQREPTDPDPVHISRNLATQRKPTDLDPVHTDPGSVRVATIFGPRPAKSPKSGAPT